MYVYKVEKTHITYLIYTLNKTTTMKMTKKEREEFLKQHELDWETFTEKQKENFNGLSKTLDAEIPKTIEQVREEIQDKITRFNKNNI